MSENRDFITKYKVRLQELGVPSKVRNRIDWELLHYKCQPGFLIVANRILDAFSNGELSQLYLAFDGYRAPQLQLDMVKRNVSKALPWQSAHNYGMAVDFVGWNPAEQWNWQPADSPDWGMIGRIAVNAGMLRPIAWDKPHVEHPLWTSIKKLVV